MPVMKGWKFPISVDKASGKIQTIEDNENVKQNVNIILKTEKFERKMVPTFGTDLKSFMFEIVNPPFISKLKDTIKTSLKTWEEHIDEIEINAKGRNGPVSNVEVEIEYTTDIYPTVERVTEDLKLN